MTTWKDIKDQPIYILGLTIIASVSGTAAFYEKFLVPARDPNAIQRAAILQSQLDTSQRLVAEIQPLQQRLQKAESDLAARTAELQDKLKAAQQEGIKAAAEAKARVQAAEWANTFPTGSPYPVGLEKVKIGDSIEKLSAAYPDLTIGKSGRGYYSIDATGHAVFDRATFYFPLGGKDDRITHIVYWSSELRRRDDKDDWLLTRLTTSLGTPKTWEEGYYSWERNGAPSTFVRYGTLQIMKAGWQPNGWPTSPKP